MKPGCFSSIEKFISNLCKLFERSFLDILRPNKSALPLKSSNLGRFNSSKNAIISFAINLKSWTTCSGAPGNFALRFSSCVAIPTGHVFS